MHCNSLLLKQRLIGKRMLKMSRLEAHLFNFVNFLNLIAAICSHTIAEADFQTRFIVWHKHNCTVLMSHFEMTSELCGDCFHSARRN